MERDRYLNYLLIGNLRYALMRDNDLAIGNFKMTFNETINWYSDNFMKKYIVNKLVDEIMTDLRYNKRRDSEKWLKFVSEITKSKK